MSNIGCTRLSILKQTNYSIQSLSQREQMLSITGPLPVFAKNTTFTRPELLCSMEDACVFHAHQNALHSGDSPSESLSVSEDVDETVFVVDGTALLKDACRRHGLDFR